MTEACYTNIEELEVIFADYGDALTNGKQVSSNLAHNMGDIYDNVEAFINMRNTVNNTDPVYWKMAGELIGGTIKAIGFSHKQ